MKNLLLNENELKVKTILGSQNATTEDLINSYNWLFDLYTSNMYDNKPTYNYKYKTFLRMFSSSPEDKKAIHMNNYEVIIRKHKYVRDLVRNTMDREDFYNECVLVLLQLVDEIKTNFVNFKNYVTSTFNHRLFDNLHLRIDTLSSDNYRKEISTIDKKYDGDRLAKINIEMPSGETCSAVCYDNEVVLSGHYICGTPTENLSMKDECDISSSNFIRNIGVNNYYSKIRTRSRLAYALHINGMSIDRIASNLALSPEHINKLISKINKKTLEDHKQDYDKDGNPVWRNLTRGYLLN